MRTFSRTLCRAVLLGCLGAGLLAGPVWGAPALPPVQKPGSAAAKPVSPVLRRQPVPQFTTHYTAAHPASLHPTLRWKPILGTVYYNVKVQLPNGSSLPDDRTYVAGYNLALPAGTRGDVSVQIQSFDLDEKPVSALSPVEKVHVDPDRKTALYPDPISQFNSGNGTTLLYPVYNWVPLNGVRHYEVEVLKTNAVSPTREAAPDQLLERGKSTGFDWYDDESHYAPYTMYWRVRGIDEAGNPVSQFCPPQPMKVDPEDNWQVGTPGGQHFPRRRGSFLFSKRFCLQLPVLPAL